MAGAQRYCHHFQHLYASGFQLQGCFGQRDPERLSYRDLRHGPPMSLLRPSKIAQKRDKIGSRIRSWRDMGGTWKNPQPLENKGVAGMVPVAGLEPARHRWQWILSSRISGKVAARRGN